MSGRPEKELESEEGEKKSDFTMRRVGERH